MNFSIVGKPKVIMNSTNLGIVPMEIKKNLDDYDYIVFDELPSKFPLFKSISNHIDLILVQVYQTKQRIE